jgi:methionyl-tRNA formyltransferase
LRSAAAAQETLAQLTRWQPDVMVVVAYGLILPHAVLELPRLGCLNIHASLLPRWRGAAPIQRAILAGDATTGVSIMQMDAGLDTGGVLCEASIDIGAQSTAGDLQAELAELGAHQILSALKGLAGGTLSARPQTDAGVTYAAKLARAESGVDWRRAAVDIDRQVRALNPWPVAETRLEGEVVKVLRSRMAADNSRANDAQPGTLLDLRDDALEVACGAGVLQLLELQRAGRKPVAARAFVNGLQPRHGAVFR